MPDPQLTSLVDYLSQTPGTGTNFHAYSFLDNPTALGWLRSVASSRGIRVPSDQQIQRLSPIQRTRVNVQLSRILTQNPSTRRNFIAQVQTFNPTPTATPRTATPTNTNNNNVVVPRLRDLTTGPSASDADEAAFRELQRQATTTTTTTTVVPTTPTTTNTNSTNTNSTNTNSTNTNSTNTPSVIIEDSLRPANNNSVSEPIQNIETPPRPLVGPGLGQTESPVRTNSIPTPTPRTTTPTPRTTPRTNTTNTSTSTTTIPSQTPIQSPGIVPRTNTTNTTPTTSSPIIGDSLRPANNNSVSEPIQNNETPPRPLVGPTQTNSSPTVAPATTPRAVITVQDIRNRANTLSQQPGLTRTQRAAINSIARSTRNRTPEQLQDDLDSLNSYVLPSLQQSVSETNITNAQANTSPQQEQQEQQQQQLQPLEDSESANISSATDPSAGIQFPAIQSSSGEFLDPNLESNVRGLETDLDSTTNEIASIQARLADEAAGIQQQAAADARDVSIQAANRRALNAAEQQTAGRDLISLLQQSIRTTIDPNRLYGEGRTANRILAAASIALGRIGANFVGQAQNEALGIINAAIDRDIQVQVANMQQQHANIQEQKGLLTSLIAQGHDIDQATAAARAALFEDASKRVEALGNQLTDNGQSQRARLLSLNLHQEALKAGLPVAVKVLELDSKRRSARELGTNNTATEGGATGSIQNPGLTQRQLDARTAAAVTGLRRVETQQRVSVARSVLSLRDFIRSHPAVLRDQQLGTFLRNNGLGAIDNFINNINSSSGRSSREQQQFLALLSQAKERLGRAQSGAAISETESSTFNSLVNGLAGGNPNVLAQQQTQWVLGVMRPDLGPIIEQSSGSPDVQRTILSSVTRPVYDLVVNDLRNDGIEVVSPRSTTQETTTTTTTTTTTPQRQRQQRQQGLPTTTTTARSNRRNTPRNTAQNPGSIHLTPDDF